jgi:hypothetical protein
VILDRLGADSSTGRRRDFRSAGRCGWASLITISFRRRRQIYHVRRPPPMSQDVRYGAALWRNVAPPALPLYGRSPGAFSPTNSLPPIGRDAPGPPDPLRPPHNTPHTDAEPLRKAISLCPNAPSQLASRGDGGAPNHKEIACRNTQALVMVKTGLSPCDSTVGDPREALGESIDLIVVAIEELARLGDALRKERPTAFPMRSTRARRRRSTPLRRKTAASFSTPSRSLRSAY